MFLLCNVAARLGLTTMPETDETRMLWLTTYLKTKNEIEGRPDSDISSTELERWKVVLEMMDGVGVRILYFSSPTQLYYCKLSESSLILLPLNHAPNMNNPTHHTKFSASSQVQHHYYWLRDYQLYGILISSLWKRYEFI